MRESERGPRKFEGIVLEETGGWIVSDPDGPGRPIELCRLELEGTISE